MPDKQAVVLIHGIGEQRPMDTLRGFVDTVWTQHEAIHHEYAPASTWSKPDDVSESFELRRLTTSQNRSGARTDFFEFYWAHMMRGTTLGHVGAWARTLLLRRPGTLPPALRPAWLVLIALLAGALALAVNAALSQEARFIPMPSWLSGLASAALLPLIYGALRNTVGDAARYLHVAPSNIQSRHRIRSEGVKLLRALHEPERGYDRIIVVGHSLGSVIGYDILKYAWAELHDRVDLDTERSERALEALEELAAGESLDAETYAAAQSAYADELAANGNPWRVSDFVTLGSPLAHAEVLLAHDAESLARKRDDRELPSCPPALETEQRDNRERQRFSFERSFEDSAGRPHRRRVPHHAAVFAPVRWTNLYFPVQKLVYGDVIAGPLAPIFGAGICDVPVATPLRGGLLSHTLYWKRPEHGSAQNVEALRKALRLA